MALWVLLSGAAIAQEGVPREDLDHLKALVGSGHCDRAMIGVKVLRERYPGDPDLYIVEANCLLAENRREETRFVPEAYRILRARASGDLVRSDRRSALYETVPVYDPEIIDRADALLGEALRRAPFRRDLHVGRCYLYQVAERHEALRQAAATAAIRVPDEETAKALLSYVDAYINRGDGEHAIALGETIAEHFGESPLVWATLARARLISGDLDGARTAYAQAATQDVSNLRILEGAAEVEMLARSWAEAADLLNRVLQRRPKDNTARFNIAWCQARSQPLEAVSHVQDLLVDSQGRGGPMIRAAVDFREMLSVFPRPPSQDWYELGVRMAQDSLHAAAIAAWDFALELDPTHRPSLEAMAELYATLRLSDEARGAYEKLRALGGEDTDAPPVDARIAWAYVMAGRYDDALDAYRRTPNPDAYALEIASVHLSRGDVDEARRWLVKAAADPATADEARRRLTALPAPEPGVAGPDGEP